MRGCLNQNLRSCPPEIRPNDKSAKERRRERGERGAKDEKLQQEATGEEDKRIPPLKRHILFTSLSDLLSHLFFRMPA